MSKPYLKIFAVTVSSLIASLGCSTTETIDTPPLSEIHRVDADIWADNWFALYVDEKLVKEDSTQITEELSFNAETFSFETTLPAQGAVIIRDYIENDSGLEYIGRTGRLGQQVGDGGFQAQFVNAETDQLLVVSDDSWQCKSIHRAPLNDSCVQSSNPLQECQSEIEPEPANWKRADFDSSGWPSAVIHSAEAVGPFGPLGGFRRVQWNPSARIIWTEDLVIDNILLCRFILAEPK